MSVFPQQSGKKQQARQGVLQTNGFCFQLELLHHMLQLLLLVAELSHLLHAAVEPALQHCVGCLKVL